MNAATVYVKHRHGLSHVRLRETLSGYLLVAPSLLGFLVLTLFGIVFSLAMAFTDWNLLKGVDEANFIGLKNFKDMFSDVYLRASIRNNLLLLLVVPISLFLSAVLANVMNRAIYGKGGARALFFLPYVTNMVAIATVWQALFHKSRGPINVLLMILGISEEALPGWLSSSKWALLGVAIVLLWKNLGYNILMYSGALQSIPKDYYEAADLDGANAVQKFFHITLPQLKPTSFMLTILGIISSLQMWSFVQIITNGGPGTATYTVGLYIYRSAFITYRTGFACALAWVLCFAIMIVTVFRWRTERKYENE
ncbi:MAG: sugar ABC transporter permease [Oscillospiraceae bacterium]|nr:sugar ABC transporter permease [Oscillospiraceae bacterium]